MRCRARCLHNLKHNKVLHERVVFLRVDVQDMPFVPPDKRLTVKKLGKGFFSVEVHFGFFQTPDVPQALEGARAYGLALDLDATTFFIRRETLVPSAQFGAGPMASARSSSSSTARRWRRRGSSGLPPGRVVELGSQTEI